MGQKTQVHLISHGAQEAVAHEVFMGPFKI